MFGSDPVHSDPASAVTASRDYYVNGRRVSQPLKEDQGMSGELARTRSQPRLYGDRDGVLDNANRKVINTAEDGQSNSYPHIHLWAMTPPIVMKPPQPSSRRNRDPAPCPQIEPAHHSGGLVQVAAKKKKRQHKRDMKQPEPAVNIVRGFHTPVTSGGEDSDYSGVETPKLAASWMKFPSGTSTPGSKPQSSYGGISALKQKLDALSLDTRSARPSLTRLSSHVPLESSGNETDNSGQASEASQSELRTYRVPLEHDFTSADATSLQPADSVNTEGIDNIINRKMTAADFEPLRCLGKGAFGTVILVKQRATGRLYAQKQLRKALIVTHKARIEQAKAERAILESVNRHPFVVKLYYAFQDHAKLYLILEYAQGGELFSHLAMEGLFDADKAAFYMAEMVLALDHLHRNLGVVYRDLKPENCLLDAEGHLLLTDFGLSKVALDDEGVCNSILGTIDYMAPEVVNGSNYGFAVDWWSLGALGFDLLTGAPPFQANNHAKTQEKILRQKPTFPYFLGPDAKDILTRLLRKEPAKRLGGNMPKDMQTIKKHRFFKKIDWAKLERRELEPPIQPIVGDPEMAQCFSKDFTDLAVSPTETRSCLTKGTGATDGDADGRERHAQTEWNPFGGFSFVASSSLLESGMDGFLEDGF